MVVVNEGEGREHGQIRSRHSRTMRPRAHLLRPSPGACCVPRDAELMGICKRVTSTLSETAKRTSWRRTSSPWSTTSTQCVDAHIFPSDAAAIKSQSIAYDCS